jgi:hypothetical protein
VTLARSLACLACTALFAACGAPKVPAAPVVVVGPATFAIDAPTVDALDPFKDARIAVGTALAGSLAIHVVDETNPTRDASATLALDGPLRIGAVPFGDSVDVSIDVVEPSGVVVGRGFVAGVKLSENAVVDVPVRKPIAYVADAAFPTSGDAAVSAVDLSTLADDGLGDGGKIATRVDRIGGDLAATSALALTDDARFLAIADASARVRVLDTKTDAAVGADIALPVAAGALVALQGGRVLALPAAGTNASSVLVVDVGDSRHEVEAVALADVGFPNAIVDTRGAALVDAHTALLAVEIDPAGGGEVAGIASVDLAAKPPAVKMASTTLIAEARDIRVIADRAYLLGDNAIDVVDVATLADVVVSPLALPVGNGAVRLSVYPSTTAALVVDCGVALSVVIGVDGTVISTGLANVAASEALPDGATNLGVGAASMSLLPLATGALAFTPVTVSGFAPTNLVAVAVPFSIRL